MKKLLLAIASLWLSLSPAFAVNVNIDGLPAAASVAGANLFECEQGGINNKCTGTQILTFMNSQFSGDLTVTAGGVVTLKNTGPGATGPLGSATVAPIITIDAQGRVTALSSATVTPAIASVTGLGTGIATALGVNVGTAGSVVVNGGALGTPASGVGTNLTGTAAGLTAGNVTTNANLTGDVTSAGNATTYAGVVPAAKGGAGTITGALKGSGAGVVSQAACADLSNGATGCSTAVGTAGATIGLLNAANSWSGVQTFAASDIVLTGGSGCATFTAGVLGSTGSACGGSGSTGANPTATASDTAVNGVATTFMRSDAAPAIQKASAAQFGLVEVDGTTIKATAGVISAPPIVTSRTVTGATDTILAADLGNVVFYNSASAIAVTQPAPSGSFAAGFFTTLCNINAGVPTVTPGSGNIGGAGTYALPAGTAAAPRCTSYQSDGTNFNVVPNFMPTGTGVAAAMATSLSAAGGLTSTIASGTATGGTSAIASAACGTVITVSAPNTATTDVVTVGFNGDPTAITGFIPATTGMLSIIAYPTSGNINIKECNNTSASITPGAHTYNWRVAR